MEPEEASENTMSDIVEVAHKELQDILPSNNIASERLISDCNVVKGHKSDVNSCSISKSGLLATASGDRSISLWKVSSSTAQLTLVETLLGHSYGVNYCSFSPQGTLLASSSTDSSTIVWDVASRSQLATFLQPSGAGVRVCQFCPESPFLATAGDDDQVCVWDLAQKQLVRSINAHEATIFALAFSPEGSVLVSTDTEGRMKVWAALAQHHAPLASQEVAHDLGVTSSAFSPSFTSSALQTKLTLATTGQDGLLMIWNLETGSSTSITQAHKVFAHEGSAMCVAWNLSGELLATAGGDKMVRVWQIDDVDGLCCKALLTGHTRFVTSCCFSNTGDFIVSGSNDRSVRVWRLNGAAGEENPEEVGLSNAVESRQENRFQASLTRQQEKVGKPFRLESHTSDVNSCAFNGLVLATGSADKSVRVWKLDSESSSWVEEDFSPLLGHSYSVYSVAFTSKEHIVSASLDGSIIVWDSQTGAQVRRHNHPQSTGFRSVSSDPTGQIVAAGGDDDRCHIFTTISSSKRCFKLPAHPNTVFATSISIDGKLLAVGCSGEVLKIWNILALASSEEAKEPSLMFTKEEVHDLGILCCAFLPDDDGSDKTLVTGGNDALIKVWRIQAGSERKKEMFLEHTLSKHSGPVMSVAFSPCGKYFASSSGDKTAKVWSSSTWQVVLTLPQHCRYITGCALSLDNMYMATCCENYVQVWKLQLGQELQEGATAAINDTEEAVPDEFYCPITYDLMKNPVRCSDGFTYEESAIKEWLTTRRNTSPMTNLEIKVISLTPDPELKKRIEEFKRGR